MIRIRVFSYNEKGKIEFTKEELQKLLNDVYNEGKADSYTILMVPILQPHLTLILQLLQAIHQHQLIKIILLL